MSALNDRVDRVIRQLALVLFPAGFAAACPFVAELCAHLPLWLFEAERYDTHTHYFDAANAGDVGYALGCLWVVLEWGLLSPALARCSTWLRAVSLSCGLGLLLIPCLVWGLGFPWDFPWLWWGVALGMGAGVARALDSPGWLGWLMPPALALACFYGSYRLAQLPDLPWSAASLGPVVAGTVAGVMLRQGRFLGRRWGLPSPLTLGTGDG